MRTFPLEAYKGMFFAYNDKSCLFETEKVFEILFDIVGSVIIKKTRCDCVRKRINSIYERNLNNAGSFSVNVRKTEFHAVIPGCVKKFESSMLLCRSSLLEKSIFDTCID